jgi:hypothetical protein
MSISLQKYPGLTDCCQYKVCSRSIRIGIVVVVHWVGCVCNQSWHVRTCLSNSWHKLQAAAFAQLAVVGRGSKTCVYIIEILRCVKVPNNAFASSFVDIYMSKGYYIIVWRCAPYRQIVTSEHVQLLSRWPWNTLRNYMCGVTCCRKEWGEALYDEAHGARIVGGGGRETVKRKRKLSAVFLQPLQNLSYMSHVLLLCVSFLRVLVVL